MGIKEADKIFYTFPYHYLPTQQKEVWKVSRHLAWGYEYLAILNTVQEFLSRYESSRILDFGCGDASFANLIPCNWVYTGVEHNKKAIEKCREKFSQFKFIYSDIIFFERYNKFVQIQSVKNSIHRFKFPLRLFFIVKIFTVAENEWSYNNEITVFFTYV